MLPCNSGNDTPGATRIGSLGERAMLRRTNLLPRKGTKAFFVGGRCNDHPRNRQTATLRDAPADTQQSNEAAFTKGQLYAGQVKFVVGVVLKALSRRFHRTPTKKAFVGGRNRDFPRNQSVSDRFCRRPISLLVLLGPKEPLDNIVERLPRALLSVEFCPRFISDTNLIVGLSGHTKRYKATLYKLLAIVDAVHVVNRVNLVNVGGFISQGEEG